MMCLKLDIHYGFGLKNIDFEHETKTTNDFHCFSLILIKNHKHSWFFNQNYSECPTLKASFSKPRQYFCALYFLLRSSRSETFILWCFRLILSPHCVGRLQTLPNCWYLVILKEKNVQLTSIDFQNKISPRSEKILS